MIISPPKIIKDARNRSIETIHDIAMASLSKWVGINQQTGLCELKELDFRAGNVPYHKEHIQDLYLLRYYAAYLAENEMAYGWLKNNQNMNNPIISSIGCGCHVDEKAAEIVFGQYEYHGYDIVNWHIKAVNDTVNFVHGDIFQQTIPTNTNIIIFPKSIGDFGGQASNFNNVFNFEQLTSTVIWVIATYRNSEDNGCDVDRRQLESVLEETCGQLRYELAHQFDGREFGEDVIGKTKHAGWLQVEDRHQDFMEQLSSKCQRPNPDCPKPDCSKMNYKCMIHVKHLAFDIYKITRNK